MKSLGKRAEGLRLERMKASVQWLGEGFRNVFPVAPGLRDPHAPFPGVRDFLCGGERRVPSAPLPSVDPREAWARPPQSGLRATWLGHSTVMIEIEGKRVLTDPVWGLRASPSNLVGPKRFQPVPVALKQLPPVDVALVSHDHYDHLDYPTVRELNRREVPFVTSLGVGAHLQAWGVPPERITELDWWESHRLPGSEVTITAAPSQHFSGRNLKDRNATLWSSLVVRSPRHSVFFSGDTGLTGEYSEIRDRLGPFDLVMLEVGAFHPAWGDIHLGPDNALKAHQLLGGGVLLPVHWGTFALAMHAWDQPAEVLLAQAERQNTPLLMPILGQAVEPAHAEKTRPWWRSVETQAAPAAAPPRAGTASEPAPEPDAALPKGMSWPLD
ncbi:MBL fold metallo-hydrolase [Hydrogenophaga taeniospiralis]|uniref:MBL fold metallo-hydrolase n=1 Tax=Hydrogenophaga taeniospiralis TaxID=65656 RepID=UPI001CF9CFE2|nr:MBL fold metallo-hydrolase [Hydrogenophaga taeniospiralis]MCB4364899.1 MBL fold metallo-hydrolase [Hydrogenophaga taeniospiralis]